MKPLLALLFSIIFVQCSFAAEGVIDMPSPYGVEETAKRLENILTKKGIRIFKRIKHSEGAKTAGFKLRDTQVVIFGHPKVGSPLMQCKQTIAIDLPQKALIWQNTNNQTFISYNDPQYLKKRHHAKDCDDLFAKLSKTLSNLMKAAVSSK